MGATEFIVAIELGSSKISGIAGKKLPDGSLQILATANENASGCIRKGVIYNLDKTTQSLTSIIRKLESTLKASIGKVYIGMGGQSLRTIRNTEVRHMDEEVKISQELIDELKDSNRAVPIVGYEILGVAPQEYKVGNDLVIEPVGIQTDHIEGRFLNIIARNNLKQNIEQCCEAANIEIAEDGEDLIAPLALANAVLTSDEKRSGCVLVDFGADTTTVSVYKNNILRHLAVIPLGGNNITKDICSQQIEEEDAELLKTKFGKAYIDPNTEMDENKTYSLDNKCSIQAILLEDIVEARINEILDNVLNQIVLSSYESKLMAGAILTGGGANLNLIKEAFQARTKIEKVKIAKETQIILKGIEVKKDGSNNTLIALLAAGKENCCLAIETPTIKQEVPKKTAPDIERKLFTDDGRSTFEVEEEEELKRQEEKERILAEKKALKEEEELRKRRKTECEDLIQEAVKFMNEKNFKEGLRKLAKAKEMGIPEKEEAINELEQEIRAQKEQNSALKKLGTWLGKLIDED
jgi:cell division protein FtsA